MPARVDGTSEETIGTHLLGDSFAVLTSQDISLLSLVYHCRESGVGVFGRSCHCMCCRSGDDTFATCCRVLCDRYDR